LRGAGGGGWAAITGMDSLEGDLAFSMISISGGVGDGGGSVADVVGKDGGDIRIVCRVCGLLMAEAGGRGGITKMD
jgi:hypothetical protein